MIYKIKSNSIVNQHYSCDTISRNGCTSPNTNLAEDNYGAVKKREKKKSLQSNFQFRRATLLLYRQQKLVQNIRYSGQINMVIWTINLITLHYLLYASFLG